MFGKIIKIMHNHLLKGQKILISDKFSCVVCSQEKLVIKPSPTKVGVESLAFLKCIQSDICRPIHPPYGLKIFYCFISSIELMVTCLFIINS
jgi:hypothetical protein